MSSSSSSLYDATLAGLDFRTLLPGLWGLGTDEDAVSDTETVKGCGTTSASRKVGAINHRSAALADDEFALAPRPRADADLRATVDVPPGQGMARGKKRGNAVKSSKTKGNAQKGKQVNAAPGRPLVGCVEAAVESTNPPLSMDQPTAARAAEQTAYPSVFFNDGLSAAPLYPPPLRRTLTRDLPRVELEHPSRGPAYTAAGMSTASISSSDEVRIEHADMSATYLAASDDDRVESERWDRYRSDPQQRRFDWADEEEGPAVYQRNGDDDFSSSSSGGYSADESPYSDDDDDDEEERSSVEEDDDDGADEPRPFPDPRLKTQQKYIRPPEHDLEYPPPPRGSHAADGAPTGTRPAKPNLLSDPTHSPPTHAAVTAYSYVPSLPASALSHLSPYASPLISPTLATATHDVRIEPVPSALPSPTSEDALQYDAAAYYSAQEEYYRSAAEDARGRNPHPRLLWRSVIDRDALEVLDAHHERIRGGPLPRLSLPEADSGNSIEVDQFDAETTKPVCLGASGLEREREHTGLGDVEMKERVRRARRRDPNRRTWSQAGRQWSRQMEQCGL